MKNLTINQYIKTLTLLCVEDNRVTQTHYKSIFEDIVQETIFAYDGVDGYQKYLDNKVDIIILDYNMPNVNGIEMLKQIRELNKTIPIIFVSAIENIDVIVSALKYGISDLVKKPIVLENLLEAIDNASKILLADKYLQIQMDEKLNALQIKEKYTTYQEDLAFDKELNILRNDFYYQMISSDGISLVDFLYQPLDVMSGDAYSARRIDEHSTFYLMVDGMGKGLSASLTAMIMTTFVNHIFDKMMDVDAFDLSVLVHETMEYIKPILLDEEALAIDYIVVDNIDNMIYYAKFAMPVLLMQNNNDELIRLKSNNPPLSKWQTTFNISSHDISDIKKFLIYSDGMAENETIFDDKPYSDFIEDDFLKSFTREDLKNSFFEKILIQEDDITIIYIHRLSSTSKLLSHRSFSSNLASVDIANDWYSEIWDSITADIKVSYPPTIVFTELFLNAYEHGNLGINSEGKHKLLDDDIYYETLLEKEKDCTKKIVVTVNEIKHENILYIITQITDEGEGFDTQILSEIFRNSKTFNGRGVFVSRKNSLGIYYNDKGNTVLYLHKVQKVQQKLKT